MHLARVGRATEGSVSTICRLYFSAGCYQCFYGFNIAPACGYMEGSVVIGVAGVYIGSVNYSQANCVPVIPYERGK